MLKRFLTRDQEELLSAERTLLQQLSYNLTRLEASREDTTRLDQARRQLDELFLLVIVGEFNAGKSAFINALLGQQLLEEGATPTTVRVHLLRHGDQIGRSLVEADMEVVTAPVEWLREINVVDTPGTNAVIQRHQEITEDFVPRSDLVLFVTSADRPFSESERLFMERIRAWGKKVVIVVNKVDILNPADISRGRASWPKTRSSCWEWSRDFHGLGPPGTESQRGRPAGRPNRRPAFGAGALGRKPL